MMGIFLDGEGDARPGQRPIAGSLSLHESHSGR